MGRTAEESRVPNGGHNGGQNSADAAKKKKKGTDDLGIKPVGAEILHVLHGVAVETNGTYGVFEEEKNAENF